MLPEGSLQVEHKPSLDETLQMSCLPSNVRILDMWNGVSWRSSRQKSFLRDETLFGLTFSILTVSLN
jgi:hypothetical protein